MILLGVVFMLIMRARQAAFFRARPYAKTHRSSSSTRHNRRPSAQ
jgi:hypothetical protein